MGMEGGICWIVHQPGKHEELYKLLPWPLLVWDDYHDDPWPDTSPEMGHDHFLHYIPSDSISATWYTNQDVALQDLDEVFRWEIDSILEDLGPTVTMQDILDLTLDNAYCHHTWAPYGGYGGYTLAKLLKGAYQYPTLREREEHILAMTLIEWRDAVVASAKCSKDGIPCTGDIETWT